MDRVAGSLLNLTRGSVVAARLSIAESLWGRFRGLMLRDELPEGEGLWLSGTSSIHMMFMRFPIDCAFLGRESADGSREVVALRQALPAWVGLAWARGADGVAELPAGALQQSGTQVGDRLRIEPG
jgi:uncharacterized membrane protein (UPF0127 family)